MAKFGKKRAMTVKKEDILAYLADKKDDFAAEFQVTRLALFGSFARGEETEESDIDLLIEFAPGTEALSDKKTKIRSHLKNRFNKSSVSVFYTSFMATPLQKKSISYSSPMIWVGRR